jgi:oxygen-independent coproporphyrinogen-3 oxidase
MSIDQGDRPLGLYVHVPFCERKCPYCDFNTYAGLESLFERYVDALCLELAREAPRAEGRALSSVFVGGGTPTVLAPALLGRIFASIRQHFELTPDCEISSEANPGTVDGERFSHLVELGVNRLSMGVQSLQPSELGFLGRIHSADEALRAFETARAAGLARINLDFMFGMPGQSPESWARTLDAALELRPEHLSLYSLIVEPETPLARWVHEGKVAAPDDDEAAELYHMARERLGAAGYVQYEVSNWALADSEAGARGSTDGTTGEQASRASEPAEARNPRASTRLDTRAAIAPPRLACQHNLLYWRNGDFLAVGPGAHGSLHRPAGQDGPHEALRWWNIKAVPEYIRRIQAGEPVEAERESVAGAKAMGETMMLGLRLVEEGIGYARFRALHGADAREVFADTIRELTEWGLLRDAGDALCLTERGLLVGNQVFERFIEAV